MLFWAVLIVITLIVISILCVARFYVKETFVLSLILILKINLKQKALNTQVLLCLSGNSLSLFKYYPYTFSAFFCSLYVCLFIIIIITINILLLLLLYPSPEVVSCLIISMVSNATVSAVFTSEVLRKTWLM